MYQNGKMAAWVNKSSNHILTRAANLLITFVCNNAYSTRKILSFLSVCAVRATKENKENVGYKQEAKFLSPFSKVFVTMALVCKQTMNVTHSTVFIEGYIFSLGGSR
jgi:hypothetical protein